MLHRYKYVEAMIAAGPKEFNSNLIVRLLQIIHHQILRSDNQEGIKGRGISAHYVLHSVLRINYLMLPQTN